MAKSHPADAASAEAIARAIHFTVTLLKGGRHETIALKSLPLARQARPLFEELHGGARRAIIYAVTADGMTHFVPDSFQAEGACTMTTATPTTPTQDALSRHPASGKLPYAGKEAKKSPPPKPETAAQRAKRGVPPLKAKAKAAKLPIPPRKGNDNKAEAAPKAGSPGPKLMTEALNGVVGAISPLPKKSDPAVAKAVAEFKMTHDPKKEGIPLALQTQNRKPLTPEQEAKHAAKVEAAKVKAREEEERRTAKFKAAKAKKAGGKTSDGRKLYDWKGAEAAAHKGTVPHAPDFSAETHTRFRPSLAEVEALAKAKDLPALKKWKWKGFVSSSPKAILRYRDLCVLALAAKEKK